MTIPPPYPGDERRDPVEDYREPDLLRRAWIRRCVASEAVAAELLAACWAVLGHEWMTYHGSEPYNVGVTDGHRSAANCVRAAIAKAEEK